MLKHLPRGKNLPTTAKQDLQSLFDYAKKRRHSQLQDALFEIRFGIKLDDDWAMNRDPRDIATLWKLLRKLPPSHVEGNVKLDSIKTEKGKGGTYDPETSDIYIGTAELKRQESFEDTVRHEVGHAVHEMLGDQISNWLRERFGWESYEADAAGIDAWVARMGGWGPLAGQQQQEEACDYLRRVAGRGGRWEPFRARPLPDGHAWYREDFGPRLACENSLKDWYKSHAKWHRAHGKAFFVNYFYGNFMAVDVQTVALIDLMPDAYAAMSDSEFFAELYALYYDLDDPKRPAIPADVMSWLDPTLGAAAQYADLLPMRRSGTRPSRRRRRNK